MLFNKSLRKMNRIDTKKSTIEYHDSQYAAERTINLSRLK